MRNLDPVGHLPAAAMAPPIRCAARPGTGGAAAVAARVVERLGGAQAPAGAASVVARALLGAQRTGGNAHVGHLLRRQGGGGATDLDAVERSIEGARGGGQAIDHVTQRRMGGAFGTDFSDVRVHTDARADSLSTALSARAFTTGRDIFFRQGEYNPGTSDGREVLAHELTHVVQQGGGARRLARAMTVSDPADPEEREAEQVARAVVAREHIAHRDEGEGG